MFKNRTETLVFVNLPVGSDGALRRVICMLDDSEGMSSKLVLSDAFGVTTSNIIYGDDAGGLLAHLDARGVGALNYFLRASARTHAKLVHYDMARHGLLTAVRAIAYSRKMSGLEAVSRALEISRKAAACADHLPGIPEMSNIPESRNADANLASLTYPRHGFAWQAGAFPP